MGKSVGSLKAFIILGLLTSLTSYAALNSIRQNIQSLRLQAHQLDLEMRRLEATQQEQKISLKQTEEELQKLNVEFYEFQRASVSRTSMQKGMALFSAKSFNQFLKQKQWTKNWMVVQNQINEKFKTLKKIKSDKIQVIEKIALAQKEKQTELQQLETKILSEERHRRIFTKEVEGDYVARNYKVKNSNALFGRPIQSRLTQKYGTTFLKPWDLTMQSWGWTFESSAADAEVLAVEDGVVEAIEEIPYFGQVLILSHRGDFTTIYAGIHDILVKQGEHVSANKSLAKTQRLYFELRHFTVPIDPTPWIRNPELGPTATRSAAL